MKIVRTVLSVSALGLFVLCFPAKTQDADQQKLIEIENAFAKLTAPGPDEAAVAKQYMYDGNASQLTPVGRVGTLPKSRIVELSSKPDPSDPNVKSATTVSDFHVDIYGDTALVTYKQTNTDSGHKDPALNTTDHFGCLDTFIKRNGQWYVVGNACSPSSALPASEWAAVKKAIAQEPKDVQQAYH
jgi:hypothetical protein